MKTKNSLLRLFLLAAAATFAGSVSAAMYKWTDKEGNVHYTETPPDEGSSTEIAPPPRVVPPPSNNQPSAQNGKGATGNKQQAEVTDTPLSPEQQEAYQKNCEIAKSNMDVYKIARRIKQADGEYVVMDDEIRQQKIQQAEEQIKKFCK